MVVIKKGNRSITIAKNQEAYASDVENYFDTYFSAIDENEKHLDFSSPRLSNLKGWGFPVWLPSFTEPISELMHYIDHAQLKLGDTAIDGGGFAGITAMLLALEVGPSGNVLCIEPDIQNSECILKNFNEFNKVYGYTPKLINAALWNKNGKISFSSDCAMGSSAVDYIGKRGTIINVESITLEKLTEDFNEINYVKLDIEGAEVRVLEDKNFWITKKPRLSVECHSNVETVKRFLKRNNYQFIEVGQSGSQFPLLNASPL